MSDAGFRPCAIMPSRNHWQAAAGVVAGLRAAGLPVFVIDDGSDDVAAAVLAALHDPAGGVRLLRLPVNQGKGVAVVAGLRLAIAAGYTHAVQVDADGQHDLASLPAMLGLARRHPQALVTGLPVYDNSIPLGRAIGRWVTHVWVWIETLSLQIRDSMCGFRVYPLAAVAALLDAGERVGRRMDFDTEIMVRLFWRGTPVAHLPVRVTYPPGNTSNFDLLHDNLRISAMHSRLFFTALWRLPAILAHRPRRLDAARHWAALSERGIAWGLRFCAAAYRLLGRRGCLVVIAPIVLYFYLTGGEQRRASHGFLRRAFAATGRRRPGFLDGCRHFLSFAGRTVDVFAAWAGELPPEAMDFSEAGVLEAAVADPRGALILVGHLGNVEITRATLDPAMRRRLRILVHTRHAENFNRIMGELNPDFAVNTMQVTEIGPALAVALRTYIDQGDWVVIAGDRIPVGSEGRISEAPFLGEAAAFPQGPYILGALMECPIYALFCRQTAGRYRLQAVKLAERIELPRGRRDAVLAGYAARFAGLLEQQALADPFQWYNFFDFWAQRTPVTQ